MFVLSQLHYACEKAYEYYGVFTVKIEFLRVVLILLH